jgi:phosphatidylglycerophosphate synthase
MFRPFTGPSSGLYNILESVVYVYVLRAKRDPVWFTVLYIACKSSITTFTSYVQYCKPHGIVWHVKRKHVLYFLSYYIGLMMAQ